MRTFIVTIWVLIGFAVGTLFFGEIGPLLGIPYMEGQAGVFGLFFGGPVGALAGAFFGLALLRKFAGDEHKRQRLFAASLLAIPALVLGGVLFEKIRTFDQLDPNGGSKSLYYEVRLPAGAPTPNVGDVFLELRTDQEIRKPPSASTYLRPDRDRVVIYGYFDLYRTAPKRVVAFRIGGGPTHLVSLRLPSRPTPMSDYSDWYAFEATEDNTPGKEPRPPQPGEVPEFRHKYD